MYSASELPEFLAAVSSATNPQVALARGVAQMAGTFDAEVVAIIKGDEVLASIGYPKGKEPTTDLLAAAQRRSGTIKVPGSGLATASTFDLVDSSCTVVIARADLPLTSVELGHAQAMGRILELALRLMDKLTENERLLEEHRAHEAVLEAILRIQQLISQRQPVETILQAITTEAVVLLDADLAGVALHTQSGPAHGSLGTVTDEGRQLGTELASREILQAGLEATLSSPGVPTSITLETPMGEGKRAQITGVPVFDDGNPVGGLFVVSAGPSLPDVQIDTATMETFASQASIALTDASTMDELEHAFHDHLTGLPNRALFQDRFNHALELGVRRNTTTGLLFLDLDRFKTVNDTFGHSAGDVLLREVGDALRQICRACDSVARLGGDEFALVLEDCHPKTALIVANKLLANLADVTNPTRAADGTGVSIGIALSEPGCESVDELMRRADIAMYAAKAGGRGKAVLYKPSMGQTRLDHNAAANALRRALERDEFVVHYQPIVDLRTRQILSVEALVRWMDPEKGLVPPGAFIDDAEETDLIVPIGRRVLEIACEQAARWRRDTPGASDLQLSVNVSARQLWHDGFRRDVQDLTADAGLDPSALTLEVTESIFLNDADSAGERLRDLKSLGLRLAIDDFGTGFSSLSYIHNYPFDVLKIDRAFVSGLGTSENSGAVVRTMLALAQQLSLVSIAEGIENPSELAQLRALRCGQGQGFLFSKPTTAENLERMLGNRRKTSVPNSPVGL